MPVGTACRRLAGALLLLASLAPLTVSAHEIPNDVTIQAYIKPEDTRVLMLVRVPLIAMRDMTWPFRAPDVLDLARAPFELNNAATLWIGDEATMYEDIRALPSPKVLEVRATPAGDSSFESFDRALAWMSGPKVSDATEVTVKDGFLDVMFEYPRQSRDSRISFDPRWGRLGQRALTIVRYVLPGGGLRTIQVEGDPGLLHLDPTIFQTVLRFARLGFGYIRDAADPLLFLVCLVLPFRRPREAAIVAGAFVVAHTLTLVAVSFFPIAPDALWFPPTVVTLAAVATVYVAVENIVSHNLRRRWMTSFVLGLIYGFAFALVLNPARQFAGAHAVTSVLAFDAGVVVGLTIWLALVIATLMLLFRFAVPETAGVIVLSAIAAHTAWHWMLDRGALAYQYQFDAPDLSAAFFVVVLRWLMFGVAMAGVLWLLTLLIGASDRTARQS